MKVLIAFVGAVVVLALLPNGRAPSSRLVLLLCVITAAAMMTHRLA